MKLLYVMKRDYLKTQFQNHKENSKHLCKSIAKLTGGVSVNPMLNSNLHVELANDFANFFWNNIVKIRNELDETSECFICPKTEVLYELNRFLPLSEQHVIKMMGKLQQSHVKWTWYPLIYSKNFHIFSPVLTKIVNFSLSTGNLMIHGR